MVDLYCGAGGASVGYERAGFAVVGVDIRWQPRYPFPFFHADALSDPRVVDLLHQAAVVHASPPCQYWSSMGPIAARSRKSITAAPVDLIAPTRELIRRSGSRAYVIENVERAPLVNAVTLCATSFGRPMRRHRLFESNRMLLVPPCAHEAFARVLVSADSRAKGPTRFVANYGGTRQAGDGARRRAAMEIDWMTREELAEAIPPYYTELLGRQLIGAL